jgi:hypothetical protein
MQEHTTAQLVLAKKSDMMHSEHPLVMAWGVLVLVGMAIIIGLLWNKR